MTKQTRIKVLVFPVGKAPELREIDNTLEAMQQVVGGYIEAVGMPLEGTLYCNEEGKVNGLPPNRFLPWRGEIICGDFFVAGNVDDEGHDTSLSEPMAFCLSRSESFATMNLPPHLVAGLDFFTR